MNNLNLIGLTGIAENSDGERIGSARVGKDEIGNYLSRQKGLDLKEVEKYNKTSFAAPIYEVVHAAFGVPKHILENPSHFDKEIQTYPPWNMTLREMLQTVGTELFRDNVDPDFWVNRARIGLDLSIRTVFTDVRMENEATMIRSLGGTIIHVHRVIEAGKVRPHASETQVEIRDNDLHIYNNGTIEELYATIEEVILKPLPLGIQQTRHLTKK